MPFEYISDEGFELIKQDPEVSYLNAEFMLSGGAKMKKEQKKAAEEIKYVSRQLLPEQYDRMVSDAILSDEGKKLIETNPQDAFKESWKVYANGGSLEQLRVAKAVNQKAKTELLKKNIDPSGLLDTKGPAKKLWDFALKVFQSTANLTANTYALIDKDVKGTKVWGGEGWTDIVHQKQIAKDPDLSRIIEKVSYNEQLTPNEQSKYDEFKRKKLVRGLAGNVFLDYANLLTAVGKVGKSKNLAKVNDVKYITDMGKKISSMVTADDFIKLGDRGADLKKAFDLSMDLLAKPKLDKGDMQKLINIGQDLRKLGKTQEQVKLGKDIMKSVKFTKKHLAAVAKAKSSPFISKLIDMEKKSNAFKGDIWKAPVMKTVRKLFVSDVPMEFKDSKDFARITKHFFQNRGKQLAAGIHDDIARIAGKTGKSYDEVASMLNRTIEQGLSGSDDIVKYNTAIKEMKRLDNFIIKTPVDHIGKSSKVKFGKKLNLKLKLPKSHVGKSSPVPMKLIEDFNEVGSKDIADVVKKIRLFRDDLFLEEVTKGVDILPNSFAMYKGDELKDKISVWKNLQSQYMKAHKINPTDPVLKKIKQSLRDMLYGIDDRGRIINTWEGDLGHDLLTTALEHGIPEYMTHALTKEAMDYLRKSGAHSFADIIDKDTLAVLKRGQEFKNDHVNATERIIKFLSIDEANELSKQGKLVKGFKGNFFIDDPAKLLEIRFQSAAKVMEQKVFNNELLKLVKASDAEGLGLFSKTPSKGLAELTLATNDLVKSKKSGELVWDTVKVYAPAELVDEISKLQQFEKIPRLLKFYDNFMGKLRRATILPFPSSRIRDELSNMFVMMQAGWNPFKRGGKLMGDAWVMLNTRGRDLKKMQFLTDTGMIYKGDELLELAMRNGALEPGIIAEFSKNPEKFGIAKGFVMNKLENHAKFTLFLDRIMKGDDPVKASKIVRKYLFDYGDLTRFEKNFMRRVTFFYTWFRKILGVQAEALIKGDPFIKNSLKFINAWNKKDPEIVVDQRYKSGFLKDTPTLTIGKDPSKQTMLNLEGILPYYELSKFARLATGNIDDLGRMVSPAISTPLEIRMNKDFFTERPISKFKGMKKNFLGVDVDARVAHILSKYRPLSFINRVNPGGMFGTENKLSFSGTTRKTPELSIQAKAWMFTTGKPVEYDPAFSKILTKSEFSGGINNQIRGIDTDVKRIINVYQGQQPPMKDIRVLINRYQEVFKQMQDGYNNGMINPNDSRTKGMLTTFKRTGKKIVAMMTAWGVSPNEI